jgi:copper homeostasis protein (lipoprotein)
MKKSFLILGIIAFGFTSCKNDTEKQTEITPIDSTVVQIDEHNAKSSLDYTGTYKGNLPCADCETIETTISLKENSYTKETVYKGKSSEVFKETGNYSWNEAGNTITLLNSEAPNQYFVGENVLFHLDANGKRIEGDLANKYRLNKSENEIYPPSPQRVVEDSKIQFIRWQLVKLNNKPVTKKTDKPYFMHLIKDNQFSAFAGCNNLFGQYKLEDNNKISFSKIASTMMACEDMLTEQEFAKVLEIVDNYNFDGKTLKLNKARMAPLAEFEIIK